MQICAFKCIHVCMCVKKTKKHGPLRFHYSTWLGTTTLQQYKQDLGSVEREYRSLGKFERSSPSTAADEEVVSTRHAD